MTTDAVLQHSLLLIATTELEKRVQAKANVNYPRLCIAKDNLSWLYNLPA